MKTRFPVVVLFLLAASGANADAVFNAGGGVNWLQGPVQTPGALTPYGELELGGSVKNGEGQVGAFLQMAFAKNSAGASINPAFWGFYFRIFFGNTKVMWLDVKLDPLGVIWALGNSATNYLNYVNYAFDVGFRFGKSVSFMPYVGYAEFSYPYLGAYAAVISGNRYRGLQVGLKIGLGKY
jgi:hypothetical protein